MEVEMGEDELQDVVEEAVEEVAEAPKKASTRQSLRIEVSPEYNELIEVWLGGLSFGNKRKTTEVLLVLGSMALEITSEGPLSADAFASALYTVGSAVFVGEMRDNMTKTVEDFKKWQSLQEISEQTLSPTRKLSQTVLR